MFVLGLWALFQTADTGQLVAQDSCVLEIASSCHTGHVTSLPPLPALISGGVLR